MRNDIERETWLPFTPEESYTRRYNEHFYAQASNHITGRVLDVGAKSNNRCKYKHIAGGFEEYLSLDMVRDGELDMVGDANQLPVQSNSVDTVLLSAVLEHVPMQDVPRVLSEAKRVCKADGAVLVYIAFAYPLHGEPHDYFRPTYYGLASLFQDAGFDTQLYVGGGAGEYLLHPAFMLYNTVQCVLPSKRYTWLPSMFLHYFGHSVAKLATLLPYDTSVFEKWYIGQLIIGTPR